MTSGQHYVERDNLSHAWAEAFLVTWGEGELSPLIVTVTGFADSQPLEDGMIRSLLDRELRNRGMQSCQSVANTIFPSNTSGRSANRYRLYDRYVKMLPRLKRRDRQNQYGTYFGRMVAHFERHVGKKTSQVNQLDHVIELWNRGGPRRSALFVSIVDPAKDHTNQTRRGFPCLLHVAFAPEGPSGLSVTGFFATQYMFERAYGNYLGLCGLGRFVGNNVGRQLTRLTCVASIAVRDVAKKSVASMVAQLETILRRLEAQ